MAKDAKGHGSEKHGSADATEPKYLDYGISERDPRRGLTPRQAEEAQAAKSLAGGHPKSDAVPVHSGAAGRFSQHNTPYHAMVKVGNGYRYTGPHPDRLTARDAARAINPKAKSVATGYGHGGPHFDIRSHSKYE